MIHIKTGVKFSHRMFVYPQMMRVPWYAQLLAPDGYEVTITSGCDGEHAENSKHWLGLALDFRIRDFPAGCSVEVWARRIQNRLGDGYFVLVEEKHLHVQYNG